MKQNFCAARQFWFYHVPRGDQTNVCVSVAFEALFVITQVWKYTSIDDKSIKKLWDLCVCTYVHTYEYYLAIK